MNPDYDKLLDDNLKYAPDSFRNDEVRVRDEAINIGADGFEKAELARQALLKKYEELRKLTKAGEKDLETLTPIVYRGEESYTEYPYVEEDGKISYRRR